MRRRMGAGYPGRRGGGGHTADGLQALQGALTNVHDFLIHTAARMQVGSARACLVALAAACARALPCNVCVLPCHCRACCCLLVVVPLLL